jgi:pimeloyl-ACP methyl ester carboxylesterase
LPGRAARARPETSRQLADIGSAVVCRAGAKPDLSSAATTLEGIVMTDATPPIGTGRTVLLVHGGFADGSSWNGVVERLQAAGIPVRALVNPLRGLSADAAYVASAIEQTSGPVLAVGHSYGGAVVTNAAAKAGNVVGLVYVAAFAPDEGESLADVERDSKDSVVGTALIASRYPTGRGAETAVEFTIDPARFHEVFAADLPVEQTVVLAATQRPFAELGFTEPSGPPAWRTLPSWAVVPTGDKAAGSDVLRSMAERAGAATVEVEGSHVVMMSRPQVVTDLILQAADAVRDRIASTSGWGAGSGLR